MIHDQKPQSNEQIDPIPPNLNAARDQLERIFVNCKDIIFIPWRYGPNLQYEAIAIYLITLVKEKKVNYFKSALQDLVPHPVGQGEDIVPEDVFSFFEMHGASEETAHVIGDMSKAVQDILEGNVVVLFDQWNKALSYKAISIPERQIVENLTEPVVRGPHESTVENLQTNIGLLRVRLKTPDFKLNFLEGGGKTHTKFAYGYIEGAVNPETLTEFENRITLSKEQDILESSYIEKLLEDSHFTPFPQFRNTERPDTAVAALLEGKIIVIVSGSPVILICPTHILELLQSTEDYYVRTVYSSMIRLMRLAAFFLTVTLPAIYIALSTFHPELIPTVLLLAILNTREGIPFPASVEALIMIFFLEMLNEAGVRLPRPVGSAVSIVGALVIGQAAISAGIASPIMVVVISLTAISKFSLPQYNLELAVRVIRIPLMFLAATIGGFGVMIGFLWLLLHLMSLRSLGQPFMRPLGPFRPIQLRNLFIQNRNRFHPPRNKPQHHLSEVSREEG